LVFSAIAIVCLAAAVKKGGTRANGVALVGAILGALVMGDALLRLFQAARLLDFF